jgi:hypothetical protein
MSAEAMPDARAAGMFAVVAMKCELTSTPLPSAATSQALALAALASVSCVAKDLDVMTNNVVAGSSGAKARVRCSGSTLATNETSTPCVCGPVLPRARGGCASAEHTR